MTFEEFFGKKKINLVTLAEHEPALFAEFRSHYGVMGPKSFDHTKKYWFNELRRRFPLPKEEKIIPATVKTEIVIHAEAAATSASQTEKQGFKPMFKRIASVSPTAELQPEKILPADSNDPDDLPAKPAYIPKFKPPVKAATAIDSKSEEEQQAPAQQNTTDIPVEAPDPEIKPAYKPRFNAAINTKKETPAQPAEEKGKALATQPKLEETPSCEQAPQTDTPVAKPAYKPKFRPPPSPKTT